MPLYGYHLEIRVGPDVTDFVASCSAQRLLDPNTLACRNPAVGKEDSAAFPSYGGGGASAGLQISTWEGGCSAIVIGEKPRSSPGAVTCMSANQPSIISHTLSLLFGLYENLSVLGTAWQRVCRAILQARRFRRRLEFGAG